MAEERSTYVQVRCSPTEKATLKAKAKAAGMDLSAWMRSRTLGKSHAKPNPRRKARRARAAAQKLPPVRAEGVPPPSDAPASRKNSGHDAAPIPAGAPAEDHPSEDVSALLAARTAQLQRTMPGPVARRQARIELRQKGYDLPPL